MAELFFDEGVALFPLQIGTKSHWSRKLPNEIADPADQRPPGTRLLER